VSLYAVIPEYDYGPDVSGIEIKDCQSAAVEEADSRQQEADRWCIPVVLKVYALTEVPR
jgi:hypothetical protein